MNCWSNIGVGLWLLFSATGCGPSHLDQLLESARSGEIERQRLALRELAEVGADAEPAIPELIELSGDANPDVRRLSVLALGNIAAVLPEEALQTHRSEIVDVFVGQLDDDDLAVRNTAAFALLALDPEHARAQQHLRRAMLHGDGGIIDRLTRTQPRPVWAVPTLVGILNRDRRPGIRRLAAVALGEIDPGNADSHAALSRALHDTDDRVRTAAREALGGSAQ